METRRINIGVVREETWYPTYDVPAHMTDEQAHDYIINEGPQQVFDDYTNRDTLDSETSIEIVDKSHKDYGRFL